MKITFIEPDGKERIVDDAEAGQTLMQIAKRHHIIGIEADCGGACICATCHVHIDPAFLNFLNSPSGDEEGMLDFVFSVQDNSRLSCQIVLTEEMDNMTVRIPN